MTHHNVRRHIAMVAHDNKKAELLSWAEFNRETLREHHLYATGTTGTLLELSWVCRSPASSVVPWAAISR